MISMLKMITAALRDKTLFGDAPAHYQDAYRHSQTEKAVRQFSIFSAFLPLTQLLTFFLNVPLQNLTNLSQAELVFTFFSLFYCIAALLSRYLLKNARSNLSVNQIYASRIVISLLTLFTCLESVNVIFEFILMQTMYRFVGIAFIVAMMPLYRRRNTSVMIGLLTSVSLSGVLLSAHLMFVTLRFDLAIMMFFLAFLALVFGFVSRNNSAKAFINNRNIVEANIRLEEANDKLNSVNDQLEQISTTDPLTKVANRRAFDDYANHAWGLCQRSAQPITVLMMDIDHFKAYNDTFGHLKGDECLFRVAQSIKAHFNRAVDLFARYGGEEFVAVLPFTTGESVMSLIERIRSGVEAMRIPNPKSQSSPYVTISIGLATRVPVSTKMYDSIVSLADDALYQAKRNGRNRVVANLTDTDMSFVVPRAPVIAVPGTGEDLEKLQRIVQMAMIAVFSVDLDTGILSFSKSIIDFTGIETSELESYLDFMDFVHADDRSAFEREMQLILSHAGELSSVANVFRLRKKDGLYNWVSMTCSYMHEDEPDVPTLVAVGSFSDFSEQMRMQEITELMAAGSATYLYYYDFERQEMFFNEPFCVDFELKSNLVADGDKLFISLIYEPERQLFIDALAGLRSGDDSDFAIEIRLISPHKGMRWVSMRGVAGRSANNRPAMFAGSILDTTEQVTARQTNRLIIEGCSDCVFIYDAESDVLEFSSKIKDISNMTDVRNENGLRAWTNLIVPEDRSMFLESIRQIQEGKTDTHRLEFRMIRSVGDPIWVACRGKAAFNEKGAFMRMAGSLFNISAMGNYNSYIEELSMADRLTGLPNRLSFYRDMGVQLSSDEPGYVIMLDVDDFKNVNNLFGLNVGDRMLTELGALLTLSIPPSTNLYHLGSDLFIIHVRVNDEDYAYSLAEQLCALSSYELLVDDKNIRFTFSVGVAFYTPNNSVDEIITNAELSNRKAKEAGKNRVATFDPADKDDYLHRLELETRLRESVENNFEGFCTFFQAIYSTKTKTIVGAEALLRWRDTAGNIVPPNLIIPCLQNIGLFHTVESWILRQATLQCGEWVKMGAPSNFIINVNLSPVRAIAKSLLDEVREVIHAAGLREHNVVLEITEESLIMEMKTSIHMLRELQLNGILLAIDDFGTGYSSLSYLRDLPINEIKIDRSFILDIESNPSSRDFVKSIILLSHSMGYVVCVEGSETETQVDILTELGADILQGYYFSRPLPAEDFAAKFLLELF